MSSVRQAMPLRTPGSPPSARSCTPPRRRSRGCEYIYIYIYTHICICIWGFDYNLTNYDFRKSVYLYSTYGDGAEAARRRGARTDIRRGAGGNHLSSTTCLTHVFLQKRHGERNTKRMRPYLTSSVRQVMPPERRWAITCQSN